MTTVPTQDLSARGWLPGQTPSNSFSALDFAVPSDFATCGPVAAVDPAVPLSAVLHRQGRALWAGARRRVSARVSPGLVLAWAVIGLAVAWAAVPGLFTQYSAVSGEAAEARLPPSAAHWLGTDELGRDLLARIIYGAGESLTGAVVAVGVGLVLGTLTGLIAGSSRRWVDDLLMRGVDVLLSVPALLVSLSIIILLGFGTVNAAIAVGVASVANFARLARAEVVRVRHSEYVEAAFGSGGSFVAVLWRHVLPNSLTAVLAVSAVQFGSAILAISTLGFLGYGAPPPTPEWGLLIAEGRNYVATAWWLTTFPGLAVVAVVLAANRISASLRGEGGR